MNSWTEKGPGRKKCPAAGCVFFVGVRARVCACGQAFGAAKSAPRRHSRFQKRASDPDDNGKEPKEDRRPVLSTPSGRCPAELESTEPDAVQEWVTAVRAACPKVHLTNRALRYYLRQFFGLFTDEYTVVAAQLP